MLIHLKLSNRPLIFICHSMGGIVIKQVHLHTCRTRSILTCPQAIINAHMNLNRYADLRAAVCGILFMSTPHGGSSVASWATVLGNIGNLATLGLQGVTGSFNTSLTKDLKGNSQALKDITRQFVNIFAANIFADISISSFYETKTTSLVGCRVRLHFDWHMFP